MESLPEDLRRILGPNEQVQLYVSQKIYHPTINVDSVVITNQRIILRHPHALGLKKDYTDYSYQDIANAVLDKGILRSTVRCVLRLGGEPLALSELPNSEAEKVYGIIRENLVRFQVPYTTGYAGVPVYTQAAPAVAVPPPSSAPCPKCGTSVPSGQKFCGNCGTAISWG